MLFLRNSKYKFSYGNGLHEYCCDWILGQPKPESDGSYPVEKAKALSGEKLLRNIMSDNKIELYATYVSVILKHPQ